MISMPQRTVNDLPDGVVMPLEDSEFRSQVARERFYLGAASEATVAADCFKRGYNVFKPLRDGNPGFDLVVFREGKFERVQVKTASKYGLQAKITWSTWEEDQYGGAHEVQKPTYKGNEFDWLAIVDRDSQIVYYVPVSDINFSKNFWIRQDRAEAYRQF